MVIMKIAACFRRESSILANLLMGEQNVKRNSRGCEVAADGGTASEGMGHKQSSSLLSKESKGVVRGACFRNKARS